MVHRSQCYEGRYEYPSSQNGASATLRDLQQRRERSRQEAFDDSRSIRRHLPFLHEMVWTEKVNLLRTEIVWKPSEGSGLHRPTGRLRYFKYSSASYSASS